MIGLIIKAAVAGRWPMFCKHYLVSLRLVAMIVEVLLTM